jgi:hypothetical protein
MGVGLPRRPRGVQRAMPSRRTPSSRIFKKCYGRGGMSPSAATIVSLLNITVSWRGVRLTLALSLVVLLTNGVQAQSTADTFWTRLQALCGGAFEGKVVEAPAGDTTFAGKSLVMHVRECTSSRIRIPFHVGDDRSRTWVISRVGTGLRLKHDHRHQDGSADARTDYGGDTADAGTAGKQEFPADRHTSSLIPEAKTNVWTIEIQPGTTFVYALRREGSDRRFRIEFDLSRRVAYPPPPWGADAAPINTPDITGQWDVALQGRGEVRFALLVRKEGDRLVATLIAPTREKRSATIEQAGQRITIRFALDNPGSPVPIVLTGTVEGRDMQGTADVGGKATAPWTARKRY